MKKTLLCLFCLIQLGAISLTNAFGQGTPIRVFLLGGQSNMTGFSQIVGLPGDLGQTRENVRIWEDAQWETNGTIPWGPLRPGLGRTNGQPNQFIGPELTFGRAMSDYFGGQTIALIKSSLGATRLAIDWRPPSSGGNRGPLYDKFINDTRFAMGQLREQGFDPTIVGMIWMQGESDGVDLGMSNEYERNLTNLINDLRRDIPANNMPVGIGKIDVQPAWPHNAIIRQAEENVVRALPNMGIFDTRGFETDGVHYFQAGMIRVGYGFADVMKQLVPVVVGVQSPFADVIPIPGVVEAENFDNGGENIAYHDTTPTNLIGPFRTNTAVDIENCSEGGSNLAFSDNGEWLEYTVKVATSGAYAFDARVSSPFTTGRFHIEMDGTNVTGALAVPNTGGWQTWTNVSKTVNLTAGQHIMRFVIDAKEFNTNKFNFTGQINPGEVIALPGTLEAENFDNGGEGITYHDTEEANQGGVGSRLGPDVFTCVSSEGTNALGWINNGEWVEYTVNAASAGSYTINARVASVFNTGVFHLEWDGNNISGNIPVPNTGDWQAWQSVTKTVTLTAGRHILRIFADAGNFNLNKITFSTGGVNNDPFPISGSVYRLVNRQSGKVLDVNECALTNGMKVQQWTWLGGNCQRWKFTATDNGYFKITAQHSNQALEIGSALATDGAKANQWPSNDCFCQQWKVEATSGGFYKLTARHSTQVLEVGNALMTDGAQVNQFPWNTAPCQQWAIEPIAAFARQGVEEVAAAASLKLSPNPASDQVNLSWEGLEGNGVALTIINAQGKQVHQQTVKGASSHLLNTAHLSNGLYIIQLGSGKSVLTQKLLINR